MSPLSFQRTLLGVDTVLEGAASSRGDRVGPRAVGQYICPPRCCARWVAVDSCACALQVRPHRKPVVGAGNDALR